ncbi:MAG: hypothetical protein ACJAW7_003230, partial [Candidatus Azotimanducaceae bacterium]
MLYSADFLGAFVGNDDPDLPANVGDVDLEGLLTGLSDSTLLPASLQRVELVIVDSNVAGAQELIDDLTGDSDKTILVHVLDASADGVEQISGILSLYSDLDAVHLVSHGSSTAMQIGSTLLGANNLVSYQEAIEGWADSLNDDADLLIYGCNLADSTQGRGLLGNLALLTGADVAASTDLTGQASLGGDWDLEFNAGEIETAVVFSVSLQQNWESTLPISSWETLDSDGDGQIDLIKITADAVLNDDFSDLVITVSGFTLDATTPYFTDTAGDAVFYVKLVESGTADTGATPTVSIVSNAQLTAGGSVVAAETSVATDKAAPVIISAIETANIDGDGFIDAVRVIFSEAILDTSVTPNDFDVAGVSNEAFNSTTNGDTANDNDIYITFDDGVLDTSAIPEVTYTGDGATDPNVQDLASNLVADKVSWWDTDWQSRTRISFDNTRSGEDLTDFPILVKLTTADIDFDKIAPGGTDLRFVDRDGTTKLSYEIELWDDTAGAENAVVWVKVPQVDQSVATDYVYLYYNNSAATAEQDAAGVWPAATGVYHLGEEPSTTLTPGNIKDSDGSANNGTSFTGMDASDLVTGKIGNALDFDGDNNDYVGFDSTQFGVGDDNQNFTISVWVKPDGPVSAINTILANSAQGASVDGFRFFINAAGEIRIETANDVGDTGTAESNPSVIVADQWNQITVVIDRSGAGVGTATIYLNGVNVTNDATIRNDFDVTSDWQVGQMESNNSRFHGVIDELQISSGTRTADWVQATYLSQSGAFNLIGVEESVTIDKALPVLISAIAFANQSGLQLNFSEAIYTSTGGAGLLEVGDFTYGNVAAGGATGIASVADSTGSDGAITLQTIGSIAAADFDVDTIAVVAGQVFDAADNAANVNALAIAVRAPVVDLDASAGIDYAFTFTEGDAAATIVGATTSITDIDDTTLVNVVLDVDGVVDGAAEELAIGSLNFALNAADFSSAAIIGGQAYTVNWVNSTGVATVTFNSGEMMLSQANAVLQASQYQHTSTTNPTAGDRTIAVTVNDGDESSRVATTTVTVAPTNDAPILDLGGGNNYAFTFTEGDAATKIVGAITITDVDDDDLANVILEVGGVVDGANELLTIGNLTFALDAANF